MRYTKQIDIVKVQLAQRDGSLRIVIPKALREELKIKVGDQLIAIIDQKRLIFKKLDLSVLS